LQVDVNVMNFIAGAIIGRGGETVRNLQQTTHANIQILVDESPGADPQARVVQITGRREDVEHAKSLVEGVS
jgi:far upstream element-binding protein